MPMAARSCERRRGGPLAPPVARPCWSIAPVWRPSAWRGSRIPISTALSFDFYSRFSIPGRRSRLAQALPDDADISIGKIGQEGALAEGKIHDRGHAATDKMVLRILAHIVFLECHRHR